MKRWRLFFLVISASCASPFSSLTCSFLNKEWLISTLRRHDKPSNLPAFSFQSHFSFYKDFCCLNTPCRSNFKVQSVVIETGRYVYTHRWLSEVFLLFTFAKCVVQYFYIVIWLFYIPTTLLFRLNIFVLLRQKFNSPLSLSFTDNQSSCCLKRQLCTYTFHPSLVF